MVSLPASALLASRDLLCPTSALLKEYVHRDLSGSPTSVLLSSGMSQGSQNTFTNRKSRTISYRTVFEREGRGRMITLPQKNLCPECEKPAKAHIQIAEEFVLRQNKQRTCGILLNIFTLQSYILSNNILLWKMSLKKCVHLHSQKTNFENNK